MNGDLIIFGTLGFIALCFILSFGGVALMRGGTFARRKAARLKDPVDGVLQVVSASMPPWNASASNYSLTGVIRAPGVPATSAKHSGMAAVSKWPQPGQQLPVTVSRSNPQKFVIRWDEIQDSSQQASQMADQLAQALRSAGGASPQGAISPGTPTVISSQAFAFPTPAGDGAGTLDTVEEIARLADLRDRGALSAEEFETQKKKLLGG